MDKERIKIIISDIEFLFGKLEKWKPTKESLKEDKDFFAVSMNLFSMLNRTIDLGEEVLSSYHIVPKDYYDIFEKLKKEGVINEELSEKMKSLAKRRNILAHYYQDVGEKDLLNLLRDIPFVRDFIERIKKFVK